MSLNLPIDESLSGNFHVALATERDVPLILSFVKELAEHERLSHEVTVTEATLRQSLFGTIPVAEVLIGYMNSSPAAFAVFYRNFSTFQGSPGLYIEDLYVKPEARGLGFRKKMLAHLAYIAMERNCDRVEWWVIDWNEESARLYQAIGAVATDEWTVYHLSGEALSNLASLNKNH